MTPSAITTIILAGAAAHAGAQFAVTLTADDTRVAVGETITWTLTVTDGITAGTWLQAYDLSLDASDESLGTASTFATALSWLVGPTAGTASGASITGVSGGQSSLIDPLGVVTGAPVTVGTFTVQATTEGSLTYALEDGGVLSTDHFRVHFDPLVPHNGPPDIYHADTVSIIPAAPVWMVLPLTLGAATIRHRSPARAPLAWKRGRSPMTEPNA